MAVSRERRRLPQFFDGPTRAKQAFKDECDINNIMARYERTGVISHMQEHGPRYLDMVELPQTYHEALNQVMEAKASFDQMPAKLRKEFDNDPGNFLFAVDAAAAGDADQVDRLKRLKLLPADPAQPAAVPAADASSDAPGGPQGAPDAPAGGTDA